MIDRRWEGPGLLMSAVFSPSDTDKKQISQTLIKSIHYIIHIYLYYKVETVPVYKSLSALCVGFLGPKTSLTDIFLPWLDVTRAVFQY